MSMVERAQKAQEMANSLNLEEVRRLAVALRGEAEVRLVEIDTKDPSYGTQCFVIKLHWSDGSAWVLRSPLQGANIDHITEVSTMNDYHILKHISENASALVRSMTPRCFGAGMKADSKLGLLYSFIEWIPGEILQTSWTKHAQPPQIFRERVLQDLARFAVETRSISLPKPDSPVWIMWHKYSGRDFITRLAGQYCTRIAKDQLPHEFRLLDALLYRHEVLKLVEAYPGSLDWRMVHDDLQATNIIVRENGTINGVLDWRNHESILPEMLSLSLPDLIAHEHQYPAVEDDRKVYAKAYVHAEKQANLTPLGHLLLDTSAQLVLQALMRKIAYRDRFIPTVGKNTTEQLNIASKQLAAWLILEPSLTEARKVLDLKAYLQNVEI